jgi:16S rRNA (uracil1498-N3)-methyltransferase
MTRRRFYAPPEAFSLETAGVVLGAEETRHLRYVLRLKAGDEVYLFDGVGKEFQSRIQTIGHDSTAVQILAQVEPASPESALDLTLAVALLKGDKFDLVIQKATELGVRRFIPVATSRADVRIRNDEDAERKRTRWQRIALEATKQCGRALVMNVPPAMTLENLLGDAKIRGLRLVFAERAGTSFEKTFRETSSESAGIIALVGPEGGWSDEEIEQARAAEWKIVTLGGRILRAETAAIVIATLLQHRLGDLA